MDVVLTYVNKNDSVWRDQFSSYTDIENADESSYYDNYDSLKYLLRGIDECMPFVDKVWLIVSTDSQVPEWIDREKVNIVLHKDIIPEKLLPTFNSNTIEPFMINIVNLSEQFVYFNDDMFPLSKMTKEDFFDNNGCPKIELHENYIPKKELLPFEKTLINTTKLVYEAFGIYSPMNHFWSDSHSVIPMLKSVSTEFFAKVRRSLIKTFSRFRQDYNAVIYMYPIYHFLKGLYSKSERTSGYCLVSDKSIDNIVDSIINPKCHILCLNDDNSSIEGNLHQRIVKALNQRFPNKSKYEL